MLWLILFLLLAVYLLGIRAVAKRWPWVLLFVCQGAVLLTALVSLVTLHGFFGAMRGAFPAALAMMPLITVSVILYARRMQK